MTPCKPGLRSTQHINARYTCVLTPCKLGLRSTQYLNSSSTSSPFQVTLGRTQRCISPQHEPRPLQPVNHELKQVSAPHVVQLSTWVCAACPSEGPLSSDGKQRLTLRPPCARGCEASESSSGSCQLPDHCNLSLHSSVLLNHALALILSLSLLPSLKVSLCFPPSRCFSASSTLSPPTCPSVLLSSAPPGVWEVRRGNHLMDVFGAMELKEKDQQMGGLSPVLWAAWAVLSRTM